jgi:flagellin
MRASVDRLRRTSLDRSMSRISFGVAGSDQRYIQSFQRNSDRAQTSLERLSTGKRINRPSDDPAGFVAAEGLRGELIDLKAKFKDLQSERTQSHIRQSGLADLQQALTDLRTRVDSPADITLSADERASLDNQIDEAAKEVNRIAQFTDNTGVAAFSPAALSPGDSNSAASVDAASENVSQKETALAVAERTRIDTFSNLDQDQITIHTQAISEIEDTDFASEASSLAMSQTLSQSSIVALSYADHQRASQITTMISQLA